MKVNLGNYTKSGNTRRIDVQIEKFDTFSLDHTLANIILPALLQMKASKMGVPAEFANVGGADYDSQESFDFYKDTYNDAFDQACKRWEEVLDKMIWSFQQLALEDYEEQYSHGTPEYDWVPSDKQYVNPDNGQLEDTFTMVDKNPTEHWLDIEGLRKHEERIQEGLELFGKYYRQLWD
jgi:hypothetical protein